MKLLFNSSSKNADKNHGWLSSARVWSSPLCWCLKKLKPSSVSSFLAVARDLWPWQLSAKFPKVATILQIPVILRTPSLGTFALLKAAAIPEPSQYQVICQAIEMGIEEHKQLSLPSRTLWSSWRHKIFIYTQKQFQLKVWGLVSENSIESNNYDTNTCNKV